MAYKIYEVNSDNTETLVDTTDLNIGAVGVVYDVLEAKTSATIQKYVDDLSLTSKDKAEFAANVVINNVNQAMLSRSLAKDLAIKEIQRQFNEQTLGFKVNAARIDTDNKEIQRQFNEQTLGFKVNAARIDTDSREQKLLTEQLKNGMVSFTYTFYKYYYDENYNFVETDQTTGDTITVGNNTFPLYNDYKRIASKEVSTQPSLSTVELANKKVIEDTNYVRTQAEELVKSVIANNTKNGGDLIKEVLASISMAGNVGPQSAYEAILKIAQNLSGSVISDTTFSKTDITAIA